MDYKFTNFGAFVDKFVVDISVSTHMNVAESVVDPFADFLNESLLVCRDTPQDVRIGLSLFAKHYR